MINTTVRLITGTKKGFEIIEKEIGNKVASATADKLKTELATIKCEDHPDYPNLITVVAKETGVPKVEKTNFCCTKFSESIRITGLGT